MQRIVSPSSSSSPFSRCGPCGCSCGCSCCGCSCCGPCCGRHLCGRLCSRHFRGRCPSRDGESAPRCLSRVVALYRSCRCCCGRGRNCGCSGRSFCCGGRGRGWSWVVVVVVVVWARGCLAVGVVMVLLQVVVREWGLELKSSCCGRFHRQSSL